MFKLLLADLNLFLLYDRDPSSGESLVKFNTSLWNPLEVAIELKGSRSFSCIKELVLLCLF